MPAPMNASPHSTGSITGSRGRARWAIVGFDTETDSLEAVTARLVGFSLAVTPGEACYVPLAHGGTDLFAEKPEQIRWPRRWRG